jgi:hypothetical protein
MMQIEVYGGLLGKESMLFYSMPQANSWLRGRQDLSELRAVAYNESNTGNLYRWSLKLNRLVPR